MRDISSGALLYVAKQLDLAGQSPQQTELEENIVQLVFDVGLSSRRSLSDVATEGLFYFTLQNITAAAGAEQVNVDPYAPGDAQLGSYPREVPDNFDLWILGASLQRTAGTGNANGASLSLLYPARFQGIGVTDPSTAIAAAAIAVGVAWWGGTTITDGNVNYAPTSQGVAPYGVWNTLGFRMPRGGTFLQLATDHSAAATWEAHILAALLPAGLGQDGWR